MGEKALLFLNATSKLFQFTILHLSGQFYNRLPKTFSKRLTNNSKIMIFYW